MKILDRNYNEIKTEQDFNKVSGIYNLWSKLTESKAVNAALKMAEITDGAEVLEIACGTGIAFEKIVKSNPTGFNIGIDISPKMLNKARKRMSNAGLENYELKEGSVLDVKFEDNSYDVLINNFMIDLMPADTFDKIAYQFYRVLKPNGTAVVTTFSFGTKTVHRFWFWLSKNFPGLLTGCRPVTFKENLINSGFEIEKDIDISQNTFPSKVIKARKRNNENE